MNTVLENKIDAAAASVGEVLAKKYVIDYFQREYRWERKHMEQLVGDLESAFSSNYKSEHKLTDVARYKGYYLGPIVLGRKDDKLSIIDGQQRLTSLTLLLIYLNHLKKCDSDHSMPHMDSLICKVHLGVKSFNLHVPERDACIDALYTNDVYSAKGDDDESTRNIIERYNDIKELFPEELKNEVLPFFVNWLIDYVAFVVIQAYSEDNAYTIFETMNDRGLNLTASEMLKGYILSNIDGHEKRTAINTVWKKQTSHLHNYGKDEDLKFFQAWLRAKYAVTIRPGKTGAANEDFEKIGTRFHTWVKDNKQKVRLADSDDFVSFVDNKFADYSEIYTEIYNAKARLEEGMEHVRYAHAWGFADSLADPLMLAPITESDIQNKEVVKRKLNMVARYIETFCVYRAANFRNFSQSSIRYTMCNLILDIRDKPIEELGRALKAKLGEIQEDSQQDLRGLLDLRLHGQNRRFIKFLLSRLTSHIEEKSKMLSNFDQYFSGQGECSYEIEHIWADNIKHHQDEFTQNDEFKTKRNMLGGLILLPDPINPSLGAAAYEKKLEHYYAENLLAKSLNEKCYANNPAFLRYRQDSGIPFNFHSEFKSNDMNERQELYYKIAEEIWSLDFFDC